MNIPIEPIKSQPIFSFEMSCIDCINKYTPRSQKFIHANKPSPYKKGDLIHITGKGGIYTVVRSDINTTDYTFNRLIKEEHPPITINTSDIKCLAGGRYNIKR